MFKSTLTSPHRRRTCGLSAGEMIDSYAETLLFTDVSSLRSQDSRKKIL